MHKKNCSYPLMKMISKRIQNLRVLKNRNSDLCFKYFNLILLLSILFFQSAIAQVKCKGPENFSVKKISAKSIDIYCATIPGVYAYRARVKSPHDSAWQYFMVNAPDTCLIIPIKKPEPVYIIQMGTMCSANISDTSRFSVADTLLANCNCEWPAKVQVKVIDSTSARVEWTATLDAKQFKLFYEPASNNMKEWKSVTVLASSKPEYVLTGLKPDTEYFLSLKSICADPKRGISPLYTPYIKFRTSK